VADEIEIARGDGDLREYADHDVAKEKQRMFEALGVRRQLDVA